MGWTLSTRQPPPLSPQSLSQYLRLLGPSLAQVKDLSGIEIPEERLDDLCTLWGTRSQEGQGWWAEVRRSTGRRPGKQAQ